ncbi:putative odorant receptor 85d isoform X2 [Cylas formicarius]|uniref:putative odorant receptor 85d isoform X2 n=1 Tax=Cylas formicarius TaxID=197179 RepID=UPI002958AB13|nr:putative odorant receptor 85d isoform X2 [Cylas formicarius]
MTEVFDISQSYDTEKILLGIAGFYPTKIRRGLLVSLVCSTVVFITFTQFASVTVYAKKQISDVTKISEIFLFSTTQIAFVNKLINFVVKNENTVKIDGLLSDTVLTRVNKHESRMLRNEIQKAKTAAVLYRILCASVVISYGIFPQFDRTPGKKNYPFYGEYPFNPDNYYVAVYIVQVCVVGVSAWLNSTMDLLFVKLTTLATVLFAILSERIKNASNRRRNEDVTVDVALRKCVVYYNTLLTFVGLIEATFSYGIFIQFLCSAIVICLTGFQMMVINFTSAQFILLVFYFICMTCQVGMYCWYGQLVMQKSDEITNACYHVNWNEIDIKSQKMLIIIMERAKRPSTVHAAGVFPLNLATLMTILRTSYSYFAVLQRLYSKD